MPTLRIRRCALTLLFLVPLFTAATGSAQCGYEDRKNDYLETVLENAGGVDLLVLQAHFDLPLSQDVLDAILGSLEAGSTSDFTITRLMRVLFLTDGEYDEQILATLNAIPFWLPDNLGDGRQYWSENHMIMWMSADWLLHEKYGREARPTLRQMLVKWLDMKIQYGFYEYFSPVYYPFTIAGVLNLADFAEDEEIREKARLAVSKLLTDFLLMANDQGAFFPTCGRGEIRKFFNPYEPGVGSLVYLLTGLGEAPASSHIGALSLATSGLDVSAICSSWSPEADTTIHYGHPLSSAREIYGGLAREDRIIFQWSSGAYFHPLVANETLWEIGYFDLWTHEEFAPYSLAQFLSPTVGNVFGKLSASISRSSYIGNVEIDIYKNNGVVLTSSQDMWKGRAGYQIYPIMATVGTTSVFIRSGEVFANWTDVPSRRSNDHLPYVDQDGNVALVMYKPNWDLPVWGFDNKEVALKWESAAFDEERAFDNWQLGRIDDSYIAVKKHCDEIINGIPACPDGDGQTWAIIVGNLNTHGSFNDFEAMVREAFYEERWYFSWRDFKWVYYGHIVADGKDIDHHWLGNFWDAPENPNGREGNINGRQGQWESDQVGLFPNPARDNFTLDLQTYEHAARSISVFDISGREVYRKEISRDSFLEVIDAGEWQRGTYAVVIHNEDGSSQVKRLVIVD